MVKTDLSRLTAQELLEHVRAGNRTRHAKWLAKRGNREKHRARSLVSYYRRKAWEAQSEGAIAA